MANDYGGGAPARQILNERPKRRKPKNITATRPKPKGRLIVDGGKPKKRRRNVTHDGVPRARPKAPYAQILNALDRLQFGPQEREIDYRRKHAQQFDVN